MDDFLSVMSFFLLVFLGGGIELEEHEPSSCLDRVREWIYGMREREGGRHTSSLSEVSFLGLFLFFACDKSLLEIVTISDNGASGFVRDFYCCCFFCGCLGGGDGSLGGSFLRLAAVVLRPLTVLLPLETLEGSDVLLICCFSCLITLASLYENN